MFKTIAEKVIVGVVSAIAISALGIVWTYANNLARAIVLPQGAIVAFEGACPSPQWTHYEKATGRFLVGAGGESDFDPAYRNWQQFDETGSGSTTEVPLAIYAVGDHGGEEAHVLSVPEMPSHSHIQTWGQGGNDPNVKQWGKSLEQYNRAPYAPTLLEGGDLPHNNLPPFLAVRFCVKV